MSSLLVEGWRGLSQSYAMVNQYQLLELMGYDFDLFHRDVPFYKPEWTAHSSGVFSEQRDRKLRSIRSVGDGEIEADITYRISYPYRLEAPATGKLFVFGTSERQNLDGYFHENCLDEGLRNPHLKIVTPSHWSKVGFLKAGFSDAQVLVIPHGVDGEIYKPTTAERRKQVRSRLGLGDDTFAILSVGSMTSNKGIDLLIAAYAILKTRHPHVRLILKDSRHLYGLDGAGVFNTLAESRPDLMTEALRASIIFISDDLTLSDLSDLYGAVDCYAAPYRAEGFNLPPLEAAACGTPIVITKGGSTDDYYHQSFALQIEGYKLTAGAGNVIEPDIESLLEKLTLLVENKATALDKDAAIAFINDKFSWREVVRQLTQAFQA